MFVKRLFTISDGYIVVDYETFEINGTAVTSFDKTTNPLRDTIGYIDTLKKHAEYV